MRKNISSTLLGAQGHGACDISSISELPDEDEVLLPPGFRMKLTGYTVLGGVLIITAEEEATTNMSCSGMCMMSDTLRPGSAPAPR